MSVIPMEPDEDSGSPRELADQRSQSSRDPVIDLVRAGSLMVVVVWHWVFTSIRWTDSGPRVGNPVATTTGMWALTWVLQVMPAFFMIGGYLHSRSDEPTVSFWIRRTRRLVLPVLPLLIPAISVLAVFAALGRDDLVHGVILIISPMWFLATYLICIAIAPLARRGDARIGAWAVVVGLAVVIGVDWLRISRGVGGALTGAMAFVAVWATVHQLGFLLGRIRAARPSTRAGVAILGYGLLAAAAAFLPYPAAMVGLDGHKLSNMGPPTVMVVFLAIGQMGLVALGEPLLGRFAVSRQRALEKMGQWSMTVYAWHLCAYAVFWWLLVNMGISIDSRIDLQWWLQRPIWLIGPMALAVPICAITRRFDPMTSR